MPFPGGCGRARHVRRIRGCGESGTALDRTRHVDRAAAWALGLGGLGQVLGRLGYRRLVAITTVRIRGVLILALTAAATALLGFLPGPAALVIATAMLAGAARGVFTLLQ